MCATRGLPPGPAAHLEVAAGLAIARTARKRPREPLSSQQAEDLLLLDGFIRRPPPELTVLPLELETIVGHLDRRPGEQAA